jgi:hypothetical protein
MMDMAIAVMMEPASTSETSVNSTRLHGATTQKTAIFILAAVRNSNLTECRRAALTEGKLANQNII